MLGVLLSLLIAAIILGVVFWAIQQLLPLIPMDPRFRTVVNVLLILIAVVFVVYVLAGVVETAGVRMPLFSRY